MADTAPAPDSAPAVAGRSALWIACGLAALVLLAYARALDGGFTNFDDDLYVTANPWVLRGLTWNGIGWAFGGWYGGFWQPLVWISYMANVAHDAAGRLDPFPFHLTNVLLHAGNTVLLFFLLRALTGALWRPALVAALFALHPLHVESVAWIAERKDVLSTLFWFAAAWAYVGYVRRGGAGRYLAMLGLFALGLMAKPMLVTFPFTLLLLDCWPLRRLTPDWPSLRARLVEKVPLFALSLVAAWIAFHAVAAYGEVRADVPLGPRLANALFSYAGYLRKTLWPDDLIAFYLFPEAFPAWKVIGAALLLGGVTVLVLRRRARKTRPWLAVGWLWFLGTLVPVIGLVKSGYYAMADRYTYVPLVGLFVAAAWELGAFASAGAAWRHFVAVCAVVLLLPLCAVLSAIQEGQWKNSVTLFTRMLEVGPNHSLAHFNLATGLLEQQDYAGAVDHFRQCLALRPDYADARNLLAQTLLRLNPPQVDAAVREALIACRLAPDNFDSHHTLGAALNAAGRKEEAVVQFRLSTRLAPQYPNPHRNLGIVLCQLGRFDEGRAEFEAAARLGDPESIRILSNPANFRSRSPAPSALPPTPGSPNSNSLRN